VLGEVRDVSVIKARVVCQIVGVTDERGRNRTEEEKLVTKDEKEADKRSLQSQQKTS